MSIATTCSHCGVRLKIPERFAGQSRKCPSCGKPVVILAASPAPPAPSSAFQAASAPPKLDQAPSAIDPPASEIDDWQPAVQVKLGTNRRRWVWLALVALVPILVVGALVVLPTLLPKDPREVVLQNYLQAVRDGNLEEAKRFGVLDEPPVTNSSSRARQVESEERVSTGPFQPVADFHAHLSGKYEPQGEVYLKKDMTGTLAKAINLKEEFKAKQEEMFSLAPRPGQDANDRLFDIALNYANGLQSVTDLVAGGPGKDAITVTYEQLLKEWGGSFDPSQARLVESYRKNRQRWNNLLGRNFETIRERSDFTLEESTWETDVWLPNQSSGEPPRHVQFKLLRFRVGLIDTGWKVWEIQSVD